MALRPINTLAIGAGGCGLEMGLHLSGIQARPVCYVEREAFAAANLVKKIQEGRLAEAPIWGDARTFDGKPWRGVVDLIASGYPCQPFSSAGKGLGADDPRHLWPTLRRIIEESEPGLCFFENSPRHIKQGLDEVWGDLREMGFRVEAGTFSAQEVGADHIRERLYILAAHPDRFPLREQPERGEGGAQAPIARDSQSGHDGQEGALSYSHGSGLEGTQPQQDSNADSDGCQGISTRLHAQGQLGDDADGLRPWYDGLRREPWSCGRPVPKPSIQRVANGVAAKLDLCVRRLRNHRLFVAGNGVVPPTASLAWDTLFEKINA